jgi:spore coat polysaccharide biosynthesis protein SpsF
MTDAGVIIQARTDSVRFPQKVLKLIEGKPMLWHVIKRAKAIGVPTIVATSSRTTDDIITQIADESNISYFRGSDNDVLDRYYNAAKAFSFDIIVRVTADCPLLDPDLSRTVLDTLIKRNLDYVRVGESFPDGLSTEAFTFATLQTVWCDAKLQSEREHVTPYIYKNPEKFRMFQIISPNNVGHYRLSVDYPDDLEFVRAIYSELYQGNVFHMKEIFSLLERKPHLTKMNASHMRNEGYEKSLREDRLPG